jgi:hypothetical protein
MNGSFSVLPSSGVELETLFSFSTELWNDDDIPITYQFGFLPNYNINDNTMVLQGRSELSSGSSILPSGLESNNFSIPCIVHVYDSLNSFTSLSSSVIVTSKINDYSQLSSIIDDTSNSFDAVASIKQVIPVVSSVINRIYCSNTPDCSLLHRQSCSKIANTCGECQEGFIGDTGNRNNRCIDPIASSSLLNLNTYPQCTVNEECKVWEICSNSTCIHPLKECDNNCNEQGLCVFVNVNTDKEIENCKFGDANCDSKCNCNNDYFGPSCSVTKEDVELKKDIRTELNSRLVNLTNLEEQNIDTVSSWISYLKSVMQNIDELDTQSNQGALVIVRKCLDYDLINQDLSNIQLNELLNIIDISAYKVNNLHRRKLATDISTSLLSNDVITMIELITLYGKVLSKQMYIGQSEIVSFHELFRISSQIYNNDENSISRSSPLTPYEELSHINATNAIINLSTSTRPNDFVSINAIFIKSKFFGQFSSNFNSNFLQLSLRSFHFIDTDIITVLENNFRKEYLFIESIEYFNTTCNIGNFSTLSYTCTDTGYVIKHECKGYNDQLFTHCPSQIEISECLVLNDVLNVNESVTCNTINFDSTSTTCSCSSNSFHRRLIDSSNDQYLELNLVSVSKFIISEIPITHTTAITTIISVDETINEKLILIMVFSIWFGGIFLIMLFKKRNNYYISNLQTIEKMEAKKKQLSDALLIDKYLQQYINSIFPSIYKDNGCLKRISNEIINNHRYLKLLISSERNNDVLYITGIKMLTLQSTLFYLVLICYDFQLPINDIGYCESISNEINCLSRMTSFDYSISYCNWDIYEKSCQVNPSTISLFSIVLMGLIVSFITSFINFPIDILFKIISSKVKNYDKNKSINLYSFASKNMKNIKKKLISPAPLSVNKIPLSNNTKISSLYLPNQLKNSYNLLHSTKSIKEIEYLKANNKFLIIDDEIIIKNKIKTIAQIYDDLISNTVYQRKKLSKSKLIEFDLKWNKYLSGDFYDNKRPINRNGQNKAIFIELKNIENTTLLNRDKLLSLKDIEVGVNIIKLFILDLLGRETIDAKIFQIKFNREFNKDIYSSKLYKGMSWMIIMSLNIYIIYYCMKLGFERDVHWQIQFTYGFIFQLIIEIFVFELFASLFINFIIPNKIIKNVQNVNNVLIELIEKICDVNYIQHVYLIDAPKYFNISNKLVDFYPNLIESLIVKSYHNHLPGYLSKIWNKSFFKDNNISKISIVFRRVIEFITSFSSILLYFGLLPNMIQHVLIHLLLSGICIALLIFYKSDIFKFYILTLSLSILLIGFVLCNMWDCYRNNTLKNDEEKLKRNSVKPIFTSYLNKKKLNERLESSKKSYMSFYNSDDESTQEEDELNKELSIRNNKSIKSKRELSISKMTFNSDSEEESKQDNVEIKKVNSNSDRPVNKISNMKFNSDSDSDPSPPRSQDESKAQLDNTRISNMKFNSSSDRGKSDEESKQEVSSRTNKPISKVSNMKFDTDDSDKEKETTATPVVSPIKSNPSPSPPIVSKSNISNMKFDSDESDGDKNKNKDEDKEMKTPLKNNIEAKVIATPSPVYVVSKSKIFNMKFDSDGDSEEKEGFNTHTVPSILSKSSPPITESKDTSNSSVKTYPTEITNKTSKIDTCSDNKLNVGNNKSVLKNQTFSLVNPKLEKSPSSRTNKPISKVANMKFDIDDSD